MNKQTLTSATGIVKHPRTVTAIMAVSALALVLTACGGQAQAKIMPTWITPQVSGNMVMVPVSDVQKDTIIHFKVTDAAGKTTTFMAYNLNGKTYARADVCPPCGSTSFSLVGNTLVCNTCATVFDATTGDGISGGCVAFPKADVPFQVDNSNIVMNAGDLATAYQNTLTIGRP